MAGTSTNTSRDHLVIHRSQFPLFLRINYKPYSSGTAFLNSQLRTMKIMAKALIDSIGYCTAQILGDTERPRENESSPCRRACRFLLTFLAILGFVAIFTKFLVNQPPKRSQRVWITKEEANNVEAFLGRMSNHLNSVEWQCPCKASDNLVVPGGPDLTTTSRIVDFFLVQIDPPHAKVGPLDSVDEFCGHVSRSSSTRSSNGFFRGFNDTCKKILTESFRMSGWDFASANTLYMNSLKMGSLNPVSFMFNVCMSWAGALSQTSASVLLSNFSKKGARRLMTFHGAIKTSLLTCAKHARWPPPGAAEYLKEARMNAAESGKLGHVVMVRFNWTEYFGRCAPSFCERETLNSSAWILFATLAQVGGFVSCAVYSLRYALWPLLCFLFRWSSGGDLPVDGDSKRTAPVSDP